MSKFIIRGKSMFFHEKYAYLYRLLNVNHKQVAKQCGYDVSLLSRWKNGNRLPSHKNGQYRELAKFFIGAIKTQAQRDEINMIIAGHRVIAPHLTLDVDVFEDWLMVSNTKPEISLMNYSLNSDTLTQLRSIISSNDAMIQDSNVQLDTQTRTDVYIYKSNHGKRDAVLYFLNTALELQEPSDIYVFSDEDQGWWMEDESFPTMWMTYLKGIALKGHRMNVIFLTTRPSEQYIRALNTWLPLMLIGHVNAFYFPNYATHSVKSTTFIIKDTLAYVSLSSQLSDVEKIGYLHFDLPSIQMQTALFLGRMAACQSLVTTYSIETQLALLDRMMQVEPADYALKSFHQHPSPYFLPLSVFERYAFTLPLEMGNRYLSIVRKYLKARENIVPTLDVFEVIPYKSMKDLIEDPNHMLFNSRFFANRYMKLTISEIKEFLNNAIEIITSVKNYKMAFLYRTQAQKDMNVNIAVRQHSGALMTPIKPSPVNHIAIFTTEGNTVATLFKYLSSLQDQIPSSYHQKEETLQTLKDLIRMCD
jgi:hypothetical protein